MTNSTGAHEEVETLRTIVSSISTSARSPEEDLRDLNNFGIDWYITEEGTLMIRYWQVAAEGFVSPERTATIRSNVPFPEQIDELDWLSKNFQTIRNRYAGQWIALYANRIVAASPNLPDLMNQVVEFDRPFVTFIPPGPLVWTSTYAGQNF